MMFFAKPIIAGLFATLMTWTAIPAEASSWRHLQDLALDIQINSDRLMGETHRYVHTPHYQQMLRALRDMRAKAVKIHVLAIQRGCLFEMERELRHLDRNFCRVERLFQRTEEDAQFGVGHIRGCTARVRGLLNQIADDIHHIQNGILELRAPVAPVYRPPYSNGCYQNSGFSASFGGIEFNNFRPSSVSNRHEYRPSQKPREWQGRDGFRYRDTGFSFRINF